MMAPIFASPDIAALVAAFPPPLPTKDRPSLVRSKSGNTLLDSRTVLAHFRLHLEHYVVRVKRADLPSTLGIERADWLLNCYDGEVYYSRDLQSLLSLEEVRDVAEDIRRQAREDFVDLGAFAARQDVSKLSLNLLLAKESGLRYFSMSDGRQIMAEESFVDGLKTKVHNLMKSAPGHQSDLRAGQPSTPTDILLKLANEIIDQSGDSGTLSEEQGRLVYVPADYEHLQAKRHAESHESTIAATLNDLATDGYCHTLSHSASAEQNTVPRTVDVTTRFAEQHPDVKLVSFDQAGKDPQSNVAVVAKAEKVDACMKELHEIISSIFEAQRLKQVILPYVDAWATTLCNETSCLGLTKRVLNSSEHRPILEAHMASVVKEIDDAKAERFATIVRETFLAPLELYSQGLRAVADQTLQDRLSAYLCERFQSEEVKNFADLAQTEGLTLDKARMKDASKLITGCEQAKTLADIQSAASKLSRKQKIVAPSADELRQTKQDTLREKLKVVKKMTRASDVLQNLVWILLAQKHDGLFLSSGKDTSRMIKLYQLSSSDERGQKLEQWRDTLKAGKQSEEDVQEMKAIAEGIVEAMYGATDAAG